MKILFSNSSLKIPKQGNFRPKFKELYFCPKLCNNKNSRVLIPIMIIVFRNCWPKHPNKAFLVLDLSILIFARRKFEDVDVKYDNTFFKFQPKNIQIRHFGPKIRHFYSYTKFCNHTNPMALTSIKTIVF